MFSKLRRVALYVFAFSSETCLSAGIVPDGTTQTTVSTVAGGHQEVKIAAPVATGVSYNAYSSFNVDRDGASFNNAAGARVIVNEVTSTNPSFIQGGLSVTGARANVILANPNGISVNGARFDNMGSLVLSTGRVSLKDYVPAPGVSQRNVKLDTTQGVLEVGSEGLSGAFNALELIAKEIRVKGPVTNAYSSDKSRVRLVAGNSALEMDTSVSPVDENTPWIYWGDSPADTTQSGKVLIDITAAGSLTAGRIALAVTDKGAGVRYAGAGLAAQGDFSLSTTGKLDVSGATLSSRGALALAAPDIAITSASLSGDAGVQVSAHQLSVQGTKLTAGTASQSADVILSDTESAEVSAGFVLGTDANGTATQISASGGIGIFAGTQPLQILGASLKSTGGMQIEAGTIHVSGTRTKEGRWQKATIDSGGSLLMRKQTELKVVGSEVAANGDVDILANRLMLEGSGDPGSFQRASIEAKGGTLTAKVSDAVALRGGALSGGAGLQLEAKTINTAGVRDETELRSNAGAIKVSALDTLDMGSTLAIAEQDIHLRGRTISLKRAPAGNAGSRIVSASGRVEVRADEDFTNQGSVLQGEKNTDAGAAVHVSAGRDVSNHSANEQDVAIIFAKGGDVEIEAGQDLVNNAARVIANGKLNIRAGRDVLNIIDKHVGTDGEQAQEQNESHRSWLVLSRDKQTRQVDYGSLVIPDQLAYLIADGNLSIQARSIQNRGGEIDANSGSVTLRASDSITTQAVRVGHAQYEKSCFIFCNQSASSTVALHGGTISASESVTLEAHNTVDNLGGQVFANHSIKIVAPKVTARALDVITALQQKHGIANRFGHSWARWYTADSGGLFEAVQNVDIDGDLVIDGGEIKAGGTAHVSGETHVIRTPQQPHVVIEDHLGFPGGL